MEKSLMWSPHIESMERGKLAVCQEKALEKQIRYVAGMFPSYQDFLTKEWKEIWLSVPITTIADLKQESIETNCIYGKRLAVPESDLFFVFPPVNPQEYLVASVVATVADRIEVINILTRGWRMVGVQSSDLVQVICWGYEPWVLGYFSEVGGTPAFYSPSVSEYLRVGIIRLEVAGAEVERNAAAMIRFQPRGLFVPTDHVLGLADACQRQGANPKELLVENIMLATPRLLEEDILQQIEEKWGVIPHIFLYNHESLFYAVDCKNHKGVHVWEDKYFVEIIDDKGNPLPDGEKGMVVVTPFFAQARPLLRYNTGIFAAIDRTPCKCGRTHLRLV